MKSRVLFLLFILNLSTMLVAQSNDNLARQKYINAKEAYQNGNFDFAISCLNDAKTLLGKTNIRIQSLLVKCLAISGKWYITKLAIKSYYELNPDKNLTDYAEIVQLEKEADLHLSKGEIEQNFKDANNNLSSYNNSAEDKTWETVKTNNYLIGYYDYLKKYPNGKYKSKALEIINNSDEAAFKEATTKGTVDAYDEYLSTFEFGKYRYEATTLRKDQSEFDAAIKTGTIESITKYIEGNHLGKNSDAAKQILGQKLLEAAEPSFIKKYPNQDEALRLYKEYIKLIPDGNQIVMVKERIAKIEKSIETHYKRFWFIVGGIVISPLVIGLIVAL